MTASVIGVVLKETVETQEKRSWYSYTTDIKIYKQLGAKLRGPI